MTFTDLSNFKDKLGQQFNVLGRFQGERRSRSLRNVTVQKFDCYEYELLTNTGQQCDHDDDDDHIGLERQANITARHTR